MMINGINLTKKIASPVDCIHWTSAAQLSLLEDEMRHIERVNVRPCSLYHRFLSMFLVHFLYSQYNFNISFDFVHAIEVLKFAF